MCLIVALSRVHPEFPLVLAANRDEWLARPALAMTTLAPGVIGGRDLQAGGTWLAIGRHGVVAGLTNRPPPPEERGKPADPSKRSRGEIPLRLVAHPTAREASVERFVGHRPCWVLFGDASSLWSIDLAGGDPTPVELAPGVHVLENRPLGAPSQKVDRVKAAIDLSWRGEALVDGLWAILADHTPSTDIVPGELGASCVHLGPYGTRWSAVVRVPAEGVPDVRYADGRPCEHHPTGATFP